MVNLIRQLRSHERYVFLAAMAFVLAAGVVLGSFFIAQDAQAVRLSMKRIIFEGPKRSDIITLINNTAAEKTYRLGWRHFRMEEDRLLVKLEGQDDPKAEGMKWADQMIRYAPRRVTVPPGGSQQVRLLLRRPRDLAEGEYRSHLWIVTEAKAQDFAANPNDAAASHSFRLSMNPAVTIPVFVRHGDLKAEAGIIGLTLSKDAEGLTHAKFAITRSGGRSLYGDIRLICTGGGGNYIASQIRGIAVYTEIGKRNFDMEYEVPAEQAAACRSVRVEYIAEKEDSQFKGSVMAQATASM